MEISANSEQAFQETLKTEAAIINNARQMYGSGLLAGRKLEPLPEDSSEALEESIAREKQFISDAKDELSKRSSIYG